MVPACACTQVANRDFHRHPPIDQAHFLPSFGSDSHINGFILILSSCRTPVSSGLLAGKVEWSESLSMGHNGQERFGGRFPQDLGHESHGGGGGFTSRQNGGPPTYVYTGQASRSQTMTEPQTAPATIQSGRYAAASTTDSPEPNFTQYVSIDVFYLFFIVFAVSCGFV